MFYYPIVFRGYIRTFPLSSLITALMDELPEKRSCGCRCHRSRVDQNGCSASELSSRQLWAKRGRGGSALHCRVAGGRGGKEGRGAAVGLLLSPAASACSARPKGLKACLWGGAGGGGRRSGVPRSIPCLPEPPRTRSRERRGAAVPSAGSCLLCHFPGAIPGNYPYL